jgi:hypothetical protein
MVGSSSSYKDDAELEYESLKVGQLKQICKQRGLHAEGKKEELIARLLEADNAMLISTEAAVLPQERPICLLEPLSPEEMKEIATIADEIRHIRRQWVRFFSSS